MAARRNGGKRTKRVEVRTEGQSATALEGKNGVGDLPAHHSMHNDRHTHADANRPRTTHKGNVHLSMKEHRLLSLSCAKRDHDRQKVRLKAIAS